MQGYEIELKEITRRFGSVTAVDRVSLEVRSGEFLTLLGPSGCGKTTLLRVIAGFETPDEGVVVLGGADVTLVPPYRRNVTTVFQHYALFPHMDVFANVALVSNAGARDATRSNDSSRKLSRWSASRGWNLASRPSCRAGNNRGWLSPGRSSSSLACCF